MSPGSHRIPPPRSSRQFLGCARAHGDGAYQPGPGPNFRALRPRSRGRAPHLCGQEGPGRAAPALTGTGARGPQRHDDRSESGCDCARGPSAQERRAAGVSGTARRRAGPALPTGRICRSAVRLPGACPRPSRAIAPIIPPRGPGGSSGPRPAPQRRRTRRPSPPGPESGRSADATEGF